MFPLLRALPVALLLLSTGLDAGSPRSLAPRSLVPWGPGFQWDQLAPHYWQPQAKVLTASTAQEGAFRA